MFSLEKGEISTSAEFTKINQNLINRQKIWQISNNCLKDEYQILTAISVHTSFDLSLKHGKWISQQKKNIHHPDLNFLRPYVLHSANSKDYNQWNIEENQRAFFSVKSKHQLWQLFMTECDTIQADDYNVNNKMCIKEQ